MFCVFNICGTCTVRLRVSLEKVLYSQTINKIVRDASPRTGYTPIRAVHSAFTFDVIPDRTSYYFVSITSDRRETNEKKKIK